MGNFDELKPLADFLAEMIIKYSDVIELENEYISDDKAIDINSTKES